MGLLKTLLIIALVYYLFRLTTRFIFPFLLKYFIGKTQRDFGNWENGDEQQHKKKEGEISIDYVSRKDKNKKDKSDEGEYVDFEEVD